MTTITKLKIVTVLSFLLIVFPGKLKMILGLNIFVAILGSFLDLFCAECDLFVSSIKLICFISILLSIVNIFNRNPNYVLISLFVQLGFLMWNFEVDNFKYWYYTVPVCSYFIFTIVLIGRLLLVKKTRANYKC